MTKYEMRFFGTSLIGQVEKNVKIEGYGGCVDQEGGKGALGCLTSLD